MDIPVRSVDNTKFQKRETYESLRVEVNEGTAPDPEGN